MSDAPTSPPTVWLLADGQPGNETQIAGLADGFQAAGAVVTRKAVRANGWHRLGALWLGAGGRSLDRGRSDPLAPPWPDLVVGTGRRSAPWTRFVKAASGGRTIAVQFGQKGANRLAGLDRAVALGHWGFPTDPRRIAIPLPPTGVTHERLAAEPAALDRAAGPWALLVVGGQSFDHALSADDIGALAAAAQAEARRLGGRLAVTTSRRTGPAGEAAIRARAPDAACNFWGGDGAPFLGLLACVDVAIVTGDSESMVAECVAAGLPTYIAPVRPRLTARMAVERGVARLHGVGGPFAWAAERLWSAGVVLPPRDLARMALDLEAAGFVRRFQPGVVALDWRPPASPATALARELLALAYANKRSP